jgi:Na+-translocating ferredoxin:NAD+ oxidoreductase RnfA subunit
LKKTTTLRNAGCLLLLTFVTGLLVSGASSYIVVQLVVQKVGPIFWEGGEGYLPMFAAVFGGILAILSAAFCRHIAEYPSISKILVGLGIGIGLSLVLGSGQFQVERSLLLGPPREFHFGRWSY